MWVSKIYKDDYKYIRLVTSIIKLTLISISII